LTPPRQVRRLDKLSSINIPERSLTNNFGSREREQKEVEED
jgi:hypothetical protein